MRPIVGQRLADLTRVTVRIAVTAATLSSLVRVGKRCRHTVASSGEVSVASHFGRCGRVGRVAFCAEHVSVASPFRGGIATPQRAERYGTTVDIGECRSAPTLRQSTDTKICQEQRGLLTGACAARAERRSIPVDAKVIGELAGAVEGQAKSHAGGLRHPQSAAARPRFGRGRSPPE